MTILRVAAKTHVGRVRTENQDCLLLDAWISARDGAYARNHTLRAGEAPYVAAVCDGMGGHAGGSVASRLAAASLGSRPWPGIDSEVVIEQVGAAARAIRTVSDDVHGLRGLGSTVAGVAVTATRFSVFSVGDSAVFRIAEGSVGELTVPDRRPDPHRAGAMVLTQSLSMFTSCPDPAVETYPIVRPVRLLICSDGLTDVVAPDVLRSLLSGPVGRAGEAERAVTDLIAAALGNNAPDNVSVIVVDLVPSEPAGPVR
ncbi:PP2C family serine/threonine-protein phosphatase [Kribbella sp. NPDC051137]|jgi:protein phosphatase|uniref:PP2C family protein-serine/threonine phosphatase n=1 Tax=Kribbella sp. NPDC051137 TaxID=3155045 RepID=UPI002F52BD3C